MFLQRLSAALGNVAPPVPVHGDGRRRSLGRPMNNAVGAVVTNMGPQNIDTVLIAGKIMKRDGQMVGLDFAKLQRLGDEARDRVYAAAKVKNSRV